MPGSQVSFVSDSKRRGLLREPEPDWNTLTQQASKGRPWASCAHCSVDMPPHRCLPTACPAESASQRLRSTARFVQACALKAPFLVRMKNGARNQEKNCSTVRCYTPFLAPQSADTLTIRAGSAETCCPPCTWRRRKRNPKCSNVYILASLHRGAVGNTGREVR